MADGRAKEHVQVEAERVETKSSDRTIVRWSHSGTLAVSRTWLRMLHS